MTEGVGRIRVRRLKPFWERDRLRSYDVMIDEQPAGRLKRGKELVVDVAPGRHAVRIKIDWTGSPTMQVDVAAGEQVNFVAAGKGVQVVPTDLASSDHWVNLVRE